MPPTLTKRSDFIIIMEVDGSKYSLPRNPTGDNAQLKRDPNAMKELLRSVVKRAKEKYDFRLETLALWAIISTSLSSRCMREFVADIVEPPSRWVMLQFPEHGLLLLPDQR